MLAFQMDGLRDRRAHANKADWFLDEAREVLAPIAHRVERDIHGFEKDPAF
jgi:hypothetical protein